MSRDVRRVPMDFDWPLNERWSGFLMPESLQERVCETCGGNGMSARASYLHRLWYGNEPFTPEYNGVAPHLPTDPIVRALAERNVQSAPEYYGTGEMAIAQEALRLAMVFNRSWHYNLNQDDIDTLVAASELRKFTHTYDRDRDPCWQVKNPPHRPTPEEVNNDSIGSWLSSPSYWPLIEVRCADEGVPTECGTCKSYGSTEVYPGQREEAENWEPTDPPTGDGWQLWESITEGSPITPVFPTAEGLIEHLVQHGTRSSSGEQWDPPFRRAAAEAMVGQGGTLGSAVSINGQFFDSAADADKIKEAHA